MRAPAPRFRDGPTFLGRFLGEVLVRCPRCAGCARVCREGPYLSRGRLVCAACGYARGPAGVDGLWLGPVRACAARRCRVCGRALRRSFARLPRPPGERKTTLRCAGCGAASEAPLEWSPLPVAESVDTLTGLPLWLSTPCRGHTLWALNREHLEWLRTYVAASLRERVPHLNRSAASRLPTWIKLARNRDEALRCLDRMAATLVSAPPVDGRAGDTALPPG